MTNIDDFVKLFDLNEIDIKESDLPSFKRGRKSQYDGVTEQIISKAANISDKEGLEIISPDSNLDVKEINSIVNGIRHILKRREVNDIVIMRRGKGIYAAKRVTSDGSEKVS